MQKAKKLMVVLVALAMLVSQATAAFAKAPETPFGQAVLDGKEASYSVKFTWNNPSIVDEATNALIASLLNTLEFSSTVYEDDELAYVNADVMLNGASVLPFDMYASKEAAYLNSILYGGAFGFKLEDIAQVFTNLGAAYDRMFEGQGMEEAGFEAAFGNMGQSMSSMIAQAETTEETGAFTEEQYQEAMDELIALYHIEDVIAALDAWAEEALEKTPYEGTIESVLGVEVDSVNVTELSKADLQALVDNVLPLLISNAEMWEVMLEQQAGVMALNDEGQAMTGEELVAEFEAELAGASETMLDFYPDDLMIYLTEGLDAEGNAVLRCFEMSIPDDESESVIYLEWMPETCNAYAYAGTVAEGYQLVAMAQEPVETTEDDLTTVQNGFMATLKYIVDSESVFEGALTVATETSTGENVYMDSIEIILGGMDMLTEEAYGVKINKSGASLGGISEDDEAMLMKTIDFAFINNGEEESVLTINVTGNAGAPKGPRFDPETYEGNIVDFGDMDAEEIATWLQESVASGLLQVAMRLLGALPPEVFAMLPIEGMGSAFSGGF